MNHHLRVRRFAVVVVTEPPAHTHHAGRQFIFARGPSNNIHLVNALIAGQIHLSWLSGFSYCQTHMDSKGGVEPLVQPVCAGLLRPMPWLRSHS